MPALFNGFKAGKAQGSLIANWLIYVNSAAGADKAASTLQTAQWMNPQNAFVGWKFEVDPVAVQTTFTFGDLKGLQVTVQRPFAFYEVAGNFIFPGRVMVYVPGSGQLIGFGEENFVNGVSIPQLFDVRTLIIPVDAPMQSSIQVFIEADTVPGGVHAGTNASMAVNVAAFNFDVAPVATS